MLLLSGVVYAQTDIIWNFGTSAGQGTPSSVLPSDVTASAVSQGNNNGSTTMLTSASVSSGYTGASGQFNAGLAARIGALNRAANGSAYFEFTLTPAAGKQLVTSAIRFGTRSTSTGPQAFAIYTSVDNFASAIASASLTNDSVWRLQNPVIATLTAAPNAAVTYRIFGYNGAGSPAAGTANWRIDDLAVTVYTVDAGGMAPAVASTNPSDGASNVGLSSPITVTFNQPVNITSSAFVVTGSLSGAHTVALSGGPTSYTLTPSPAFTWAETVNVTVLGAQVTDQATGALTMGADYSFTFATRSAPLVRAIHEIQGSGLTSSYAGQEVTVRGIVTASFQSTTSGLGGFYLQSPMAEYDADPATSEGIFVFDNNSANSLPVSPGDVVSVAATVAEFGTAPATLTELVSVTSVTKLGTAPLPAPVPINLPLTSSSDLERYEGMLVSLPQTLTITDNYDLGHFGEFSLSNGRLPTPTNVVAPGAPAAAQEAANLLNQIVVDDSSNRTYPNPTPFLRDSAGQGLTFRAGDTITDLRGVLTFGFGEYRVETTATPNIVSANPRNPTPPTVQGRLRVAIGNVLNFFNGDGSGGGFPTARGADTQAEYLRQRAKIVQGILGLNADIMGLTEVENDGYGPTSALRDLVDSLNAAAPAGRTYAFINASGVDNGTDLIHVALIYRVETVEPVGSPAALTNPYFAVARPPLAQTFREISTGEKLTVCINHFRAKGSAATGAASDNITPNPNADQNDGQATNNYVRTREAQTLAAWLATDPTGSGDPDFLIIGDLNAYAKEDPLTALANAGYINLTEKYEGVGGYSYAFDKEFGHLDHALATSSLAVQVMGAATWHVNSDEPIYLDYNLENKAADQAALNAGTPYRYSDHDPVVIGLNLGPVTPGVTFANWIQQFGWAPEQQGPTLDPDGDGADNYLEYKLGTPPNVAGASPIIAGVIENQKYVFRFSLWRKAVEGKLVIYQSRNQTTWQPVTVAPTLESSSGDWDNFVLTLPLSTSRIYIKLTATP